MSAFDVVILTAAPPGLAGEAGGAFVKIDGREALLKSVELFLNRDNVKQILVVFQQEDLEEAKRKYTSHLGLFGVRMTSGGPRWTDQIAAAGSKLSAEHTHVILHDAARPAVPYSDIDALMEASAKNDAIVLTAPSRTPLVEVDEGGGALSVRKPAEFVQLLAPHVYSKATFAEMVKSKQELHPSKIHLLKGSPLNVRISGPGDATLVKAMLSLLPKPKVKGPSNPFEEAQW